MKKAPVGAIFPEGGEPLFEEPDTGIRLTAQDYAVRHGFENAASVREAYELAQEAAEWQKDPSQ